MSSLPGTISDSSSSARAEEKLSLAIERRESRLRLSVAIAILAGVYCLLFGAAWDGQWHAAVGRDRFLTPPHVMIYTGGAAMGLLCLAMVLIETVRYHRKVPGVNDQTTSRVLWIFHAPLGFIIIGSGVFMILLAAPLDNYWHTLYGIDVTVWAPFHIMSLISGLIAILGIVYLFGSEATRARQRLMQNSKSAQTRKFPYLENLLQLFGLAATLAICLIAALDDIHVFSIGSTQFAIYPLLTSFSAFILVASVRATSRIGAATVTAIIFTLFRLLLNVTLPSAVSILAAQEHLFYRASAPDYVIFVQLYPGFLIIGGLLVDAVYWLSSRVRKDPPWLMTATALIAGAVAAGSNALLETGAWKSDIDPKLFTAIWLISVPIAMLIGAAWGWLGNQFAISIRLLDR